jgi:PadR family transcriptional regulator PadR
MRRKPGTLLPLEIAILDGALRLRDEGTTEFHGYAMAAVLADARAAKKLTAYGTLYRALGRLEDRGLLESSWEDPTNEDAQGRPRRRLYTLTASGEAALTAAREAARVSSREGQPGRLKEVAEPA